MRRLPLWLVCVALSCSRSEPPPASPTPARVPDPAPVESTAPVAAPTPEAAPTDCVAPVAADAVLDVPRTWTLVGTAKQRVALASVGERVLVAAGTRLYEAAAGEPLIAAKAHAAGLPARPVFTAFGSWPQDAWIVTHRRELPGGAGGHEFDLWRWQSDRWRRQNPRPLFGDGPEVVKWTAGRTLALVCSDRSNLAFETYGDAGPPPPTLPRVGSAGFCPERTFALSSGDVFAIDEVNQDRPRRAAVRGCPDCGAPVAEDLPLPRRCGAPPAMDLTFAIQPYASREAVLPVHTRVASEPGQASAGAPFLLRRVGDGWTAEAVPGDRHIDAVAFAADGALWLTTDALLRRDPRGGWTRHAGPPGIVGVDQIAVLGPDEPWIAVEAGDVWSIYRTAATPGPALDLDRGKPLAPAK